MADKVEVRLMVFVSTPEFLGGTPDHHGWR